MKIKYPIISPRVSQTPKVWTASCLSTKFYGFSGMRPIKKAIILNPIDRIKFSLDYQVLRTKTRSYPGYDAAWSSSPTGSNINKINNDKDKNKKTNRCPTPREEILPRTKYISSFILLPRRTRFYCEYANLIANS